MDLGQMRSRPHLSASAITSYVDCGLQYKFSRVDKLKREFMPDVLAFGSAIHEALADYYNLLKDGQTIKSGDLAESFEAHWKKAAHDNQDIRYQAGNDYESMLLQGQAMLDVYLDQLPDDEYRVLAVEEPFSFIIPGLDIPLVGVFDLIIEDSEGVITIVDHKTTARAYAADQIDKNFQMTVYHMAAQANGYADQDILLRLDCLIKTKTPKFEQYYTARSEIDELRAIRKVLAVHIGISRRVFVPNDTSWKCNGCQFQHACQDWFTKAA